MVCHGGLTGWHGLLDCFESIPTILQVALAGVLAIIVYFPAVSIITGFRLWRRRGRLRERIQEAGNRPDSPELDPRRPPRAYLPPTMGVFDELELWWHEARAKWKHQPPPEVSEYTRTNDEAELAYHMAVMETAETRGLRFLPPKVRYPLNLYLARQRLERVPQVPHAAIDRVEYEMERLEKSVLLDQLFNPAGLEKVDLTPEGSATDYFTKYFQPLLVAFDEQQFFRSSGDTVLSEQDVLLLHLKHLADGRVRAARFSDGQTMPDVEGLLDELPKNPPQGPAARAERKRIQAANARGAVQSVCAVTNAAGHTNATAFELRVGQKVLRCPDTFDQWSPPEEWGHNEQCYLWQVCKTE